MNVPGRDCFLDRQDSDRPSGLPDWLWQTEWDPPTPGALPDCWDQTHPPGRRPEEKWHLVNSMNLFQLKRWFNPFSSACTVAAVHLHALPVLQLQWGHTELWRLNPHSVQTQTHLQSCSSEKYQPWTLPGPGQSTSNRRGRRTIRMPRSLCAVYMVFK